MIALAPLLEDERPRANRLIVPRIREDVRAFIEMLGKKLSAVGIHGTQNGKRGLAQQDDGVIVAYASFR